MSEGGLRLWLTEEARLTKDSACDVLSRIKRAQAKGIEVDPATHEALLKAQVDIQFEGCSTVIRSQIKRALCLYRQFLTSAVGA